MNNGVNDMNITENSIEFSVTLRSEAVKRIGRLEESLFISYYRQAIIAKAVRLTFSGRPSFRIDKTYHTYFEDPDKCLQAVFLDAYAHQAVESILGLHPKEIANRTQRYFPRALEKCLNAIIRKATR